MPRRPVYEQVIDDITTAIRTGQLKPGDRLPSIADLCVQYEASATPIRHALLLLDARGWIETHQGRGSFVAAHPPGTAAG
ncbi:GntR family transcriptional regulator [Micromonospora sp. LHW51205]|uniref:winged helix-turn-helix domain-containing protein n=1 Tax=Micromonospora sp. LHW51205 TaxID=2248752 RepID=UPI000DEA8233|nr:winged helix-turn-helix domain-containing protein [Micromonospora sp. LHW51205]RBQ05131.1 GntR family transcriptional regulator [Micromonospora sp. LHW51205]